MTTGTRINSILCPTCSRNQPRLCSLEGMTDMMDRPLRGAISGCKTFNYTPPTALTNLDDLRALVMECHLFGADIPYGPPATAAELYDAAVDILARCWQAQNVL